MFILVVGLFALLILGKSPSNYVLGSNSKPKLTKNFFLNSGCLFIFKHALFFQVIATYSLLIIIELSLYKNNFGQIFYCEEKSWKKFKYDLIIEILEQILQRNCETTLFSFYKFKMIWEKAENFTLQ